MEPLSEAESKKLTDHLALNPKTCGDCGSNDWEFGDVQVNAAPLAGDFTRVPIGDGPFVELICKSCNKHDSVDCDLAGIDR